MHCYYADAFTTTKPDDWNDEPGSTPWSPETVPGCGDPLEPLVPVPGATYLYVAETNQFLVCCPTESKGQPGWVATTIEQARLDHPGVF